MKPALNVPSIGCAVVSKNDWWGDSGLTITHLNLCRLHTGCKHPPSLLPPTWMCLQITSDFLQRSHNHLLPSSFYSALCICDVQCLIWGMRGPLTDSCMTEPFITCSWRRFRPLWNLLSVFTTVASSQVLKDKEMWSKHVGSWEIMQLALGT